MVVAVHINTPRNMHNMMPIAIYKLVVHTWCVNDIHAVSLILCHTSAPTPTWQQKEP